ncbi:MAG TPA: SpoIIE family protein phosphatase, partial [Spirochaetota bacterium]|nr:SpoIIE family protein phosphatase [Spirochaetota bacterium]
KSKILHKKIEIDTIPLFIKEAKGVEFISDVPGQIIREVIVKNLNLIPLLKFYEERKYIQIPFWELPIYLKLKIILSTVILFIVVILLYMLLFIKHKKLVNEYSRVRAIGFDKVYPLEYQGKVIEINPGEFEDVIEGLSDEDKKRHRYIIEAAEKLENEFKKAEPKKSKISTVNLEMSYADIIETKDVLEAVEGLEDITNNIFDFNDDSKILSKRNISEVNIINGYKLNISEAAEVIEEASEVAEAIGEAAEVIEEAGEVVEPIGEAAEVIEEAGEIVEPIGEAAEVIEEAGEVVEAIGEAAEVIEEAGEVVEPIGEAAEVIEEAGEVAEPIEEAAEVVAVKRVDEKITIKDNQDIGKKVLVDKQEKSVSGDKAEKEIIVEKKEEEKEGFGIEKEFKEKVKLRIKYSFFISLLVMITVAISSIINGYFTVKSTKYNLSIENIRKAEILTTSLAISLRDPIRTNDDALIIENLVNTSKIQDILYTQLIKQDIDINDGKLKVFYRDNKGDFKQLLESEKSIINEVISNINKNRMLLIKPDFDTDRLEKQYSLYYPVMISKDRNNLTEKDFGTKVIGIVRIDFSTERIFNVINLEINRIVNATFFIFVIMIGIGILGAITLAYFTVKPIKKLVEGAKIVAGGNLDYKIDIETKDEIGRLTYEFNVMTFKLKEAQEEIIKKKVLEEQFTIAEGIQRSLIPQKDLILKEVDVTGFYKAALGVGGDYFDFFQIDNDKIAVILSDVSGKGIPASLMMVNIRTVFKTYIKTEKNSPSKVVSIINNVLSEDLSSDMFATLFFYIFNKRTRELIFCNAGHGPLTYYSSKTRKVETIKTQTMPIGIMPNNPQYQDVKVSLSPGDIVVVFTDGVTEAMNETREEFTEERLFKIIEENSNLSSKELNAKIIQELANFVGSAPQHDDISLIVMKVK